MCVVAGGEQKHLGIERGQHGHRDLAKHQVEVCVTGALPERNIDREAGRVAAPHLGGGASPRIERVLMCREIQHPGVVVEDPLRPIAVMHVVVDDRHPRHAAGQRMRRGDRGVVVETEAHGTLPLGVVPRRTDEGRRRRIMVQRVIDRRHGRAGGQPGYRLGIGRCVGVRVESHPLPRRRTDRVDVARVVHAEQRLGRRGGGRRDATAAGAPARGHPRQDLGPGRLLGMPRGGRVVDEAV